MKSGENWPSSFRQGDTLKITCNFIHFKSHLCKQCGPRSGSSLIWIHTVCRYAKIGLKSLQEYSADDKNRRHFQMHVFLAF